MGGLLLCLAAGLAGAEPLRGVALKRDITRELQLGGESVSRRNVIVWSHVDFLMAELGLAGLHRVATASDPDAEAQRLTGRTLAQLKADWLDGLRQGPAVAPGNRSIR